VELWFSSHTAYRYARSRIWTWSNQMQIKIKHVGIPCPLREFNLLKFIANNYKNNNACNACLKDSSQSNANFLISVMGKVYSWVINAIFKYLFNISRGGIYLDGCQHGIFMTYCTSFLLIFQFAGYTEACTRLQALLPDIELKFETLPRMSWTLVPQKQHYHTFDVRFKNS